MGRIICAAWTLETVELRKTIGGLARCVRCSAPAFLAGVLLEPAKPQYMIRRVLLALNAQQGVISMKLKLLPFMSVIALFPASLFSNTLYFPQVAFGGGY